MARITAKLVAVSQDAAARLRGSPSSDSLTKVTQSPSKKLLLGDKSPWALPSLDARDSQDCRFASCEEPSSPGRLFA